MEQQLITSIPIQEFEAIIKKCLKSELANLQPEQQKEASFITSNDAKEILGVSLVTLSKWRSEGRVPFHRIGTRIRFKKSEVLESVKTVKKYGRANHV